MGKVFLEISHNSQENTCLESFFFRCFLVNSNKFLKTFILYSICERLLLCLLRRFAPRLFSLKDNLKVYFVFIEI